jgi:flagellar biogenesis protein FliO
MANMGRHLAAILVLALAARTAPGQVVLPGAPAEIDGATPTDASAEAVPAATAGAPPAAPTPEVERLPLGRPVEAALGGGSAPAEPADPPSMTGSALRTLAALALVVALILGLRSALSGAARRLPGGASLRSQLGAAGRAPSGLLLVLGRYPVAKGQTLVLLQLDRRVLLLSQSSAGFSPLAEITDPSDVASILAKARDEEGASQSARFQALLGQLSRDPETADPSDIRPRRGDGPRAPEPLESIEAGDAIQRRLAGLRDRVSSLGAP